MAENISINFMQHAAAQMTTFAKSFVAALRYNEGAVLEAKQSASRAKAE